MTLAIEVRAYDPIPKWYGVAYRSLTADASVCYPLPLNWLFRWIRAAAIALKVPPIEQWMRREMRAAYRHGYRAGRRVGYQRGMNVVANGR